MNIEIPDPPIYKKGMSMTLFLRQVEEYEVLWKKQKYGTLLYFINCWLANIKMSIKSLLDFKQIPEDLLIKDSKYNISLIKKNIENINKIYSLNYKLEEPESDSDSDSQSSEEEVDSNEIIKLVKLMLDKIEYKLVKNIVNKRSYYTIKRK